MFGLLSDIVLATMPIAQAEETIEPVADVAVEEVEETVEPEVEEEEEDPEPEDIKPILEQACAENECKETKHHYDECVERVTSQIEEKGKPDEDCVEEFFHLVHCITECAAPQLWAALK